MVGDAGLNVCTLDDEERCTPGSCDPALVCDEAQCRSRCGDDSDCLTDQRCERGACAPSDGPFDAGAPDGGAPDAGAADGGLPTVVDCSRDEDCGASEICVANAGVYTCRPTCTAHSDCPGTACDWFEGDPIRFACALACDPATSTGCPIGTACTVLRFSDMLGGGPTYITECRVIGAAEPGCPCAYDGASRECDASSSCWIEGPMGMVCAIGCVLGEDCPDGSACLRPAMPFTQGGRTFGFCAPPTSPTCP